MPCSDYHENSIVSKTVKSERQTTITHQQPKKKKQLSKRKYRLEPFKTERDTLTQKKNKDQET